MKRFIPLLIALLFAGPGVVQASATRKLPHVTTPVTIVSGPKGVELDSALRAAAESAGFIYLSRDVPKREIKMNVRKLPFSDVWDLLMKTYGDGIDNAFVDGRIIVVAPYSVISRIIERGGLAPAPEKVDAPSAVIEVLPVREAKGLFEAVTAMFPEVKLSKLDDPPAFVIKGMPERIAEVKALLKKAGVLIDGDLASLLQDEAARKQEWSLAVFYLDGASSGGKPVLQALERVAPNASFTFVPSAKAIVAKGSIEELVEAKGLLDRLGLLRTRADIERSIARKTRVYDIGTGMKPAVAIIEKIVGNRGVINYDEKGGYLYVYAAPQAHADIEQAVAEFRQAKEGEAKAVEPVPGSTLLYYETKRAPSYVAKYIEKVLPDVELVPMDDAGLLMVVGAPDTQQKVVRILDQIDRPNPAAEAKKKRAEELRRAMEPVQATYSVAYHDSQTLARLLTQIMGTSNQGQERVQSNAAGGEQRPAGDTSSARFKVTADPQTNTLILYGPRRSVDSALSLAKKLDRPADQIVSRVWIQEVDRSAANELGINWQFATGKFAVALTDGVLTGGYDSGATALSALAQSIRLLEKEGRSRRLLDANTLTLNAEPTTLLSGGKLLLPKQGGGNTSGGSGGNGQGGSGNTAYEEFKYGLDLELTPITSPDGTITLDIATTVGSLPESGPTPGSVLIPQSFAESRIRIRDGQAVILGGVIANEDRNNESGIPVLKDIPIIGALFKTTEHVSSERVLLIIVQSHILKAQGDKSAETKAPASKLPAGEYTPSASKDAATALPEGQLPTVPWSDRATRVAPIGGDK